MEDNQARKGNEEVSNAQVYRCPFDYRVRPPHASYTELKVEIPGQVSLRPTSPTSFQLSSYLCIPKAWVTIGIIVGATAWTATWFTAAKI